MFVFIFKIGVLAVFKICDKSKSAFGSKVLTDLHIYDWSIKVLQLEQIGSVRNFHLILNHGNDLIYQLLQLNMPHFRMGFLQLMSHRKGHAKSRSF